MSIFKIFRFLLYGTYSDDSSNNCQDKGNDNITTDAIVQRYMCRYREFLQKYDPIPRFRDRMFLPQNSKLEIINLIKNRNKTLEQQWCKKINHNSKILELYYVCREDFFSEYNNGAESILKHGFTFCELYKTKERGVHLLNHSRYFLSWIGDIVPVIVCHVICNDDEDIKRYKSSIYSPGKNSEYIVKKFDLVYPMYMIKYKVTSNYIECNSKTLHNKLDGIDTDDVIYSRDM